jgi:hypothetical protein
VVHHFSARCLATCGLLACISAAGSARAADCSEDAFSKAAADVAAAHHKLLALPAAQELQTDVDTETRDALTGMKHAAADFVDMFMHCTAGDETADRLQTALSKAIHDGSAESERKPDSPYAQLPEFRVSDLGGARVGISTLIPIQCGGDASLQIFSRNAQGWHEELRWQSKPYDKVSGAFDFFDYQVSPPDEHGAWYALVKSIAPWCSSTWSSIRYAILRPGAQANAPTVIFSASDSVWWGSEDFGRLSANAQDFEVRFHAASIDLGVHNREWIRHYAVNGDRVRRIAPVAQSSRDFADEWIVSPWMQARAWSDPKNIVALKRWHERLRGIDESPSYEFSAIHACTDGAHHVEVDIVDPRNDAEYFLSVDGDKTFVLRGVAEHASARCNGVDLLRQLQTQ